MKGYWITLCNVTDPEGYGEYIKLAGPAIEKFGGRFWQEEVIKLNLKVILMKEL